MFPSFELSVFRSPLYSVRYLNALVIENWRLCNSDLEFIRISGVRNLDHNSTNGIFIYLSSKMECDHLQQERCELLEKSFL